MTEETQIVPIRPSSPLPRSEARDLAGEVAKCLKLVAPSSMGAEQQTVWLHAAVDALDDIRPEEVRNISAELRRSVTRPAQIVPEIAKMVAAKRSRSSQSHKPVSPFMAEREINLRGLELRAAAKGDQRRIEEAWQGERSARADAGLAVPPIEKPLSADELSAMAPHVRDLGLSLGFLAYRGGQLIEQS